jgi:integrase
LYRFNLVMSTAKTAAKTRKRRDRLDPRAVRIGARIFWQVSLGSEFRDGRRRRLRKTFANREEAETFARLRKIERINHGAAGVNLSPRFRGEMVEAAKLLEPYPVSVLDLVREYVQRMEQRARSETVSNALGVFLLAKQGDGLRRRYLEDLRDRLRRFADSFGASRLSDITPAQIDTWLRETYAGLSAWSRVTSHARLRTFFQFARQRGWVSVNPLADLPKAKVITSPPGILSPEQVARLLESSSQEMLPYWALGMFAGLRSAEVGRLEWRHIKWDERLIEVPALSSKTASRRLVTMLPNLLAWLEPYRNHQGPICLPNHYKRMIDDRQRAGIGEWPANGLRHSYASYHLAAFRDAPALSLELGHVRPQTVFAHYREVVSPAEAQKFWRIVPVISDEPKIQIVA